MKIMYYCGRFKISAAALVGTLSLFSTFSTATTVPQMGNLPLSSSGRWIVDANGVQVPIVGVNWPGAADTMLPEGLQYQSIEGIVGKISGLGFNAVRLTFAMEMVDDILDGGGDVSLAQTLGNALGPTNGTVVLQKILANNPQFTSSTTRLQVFDAVANELGRQNIYLHLDNHVSKAMWCCELNDGNAWFGDTYFDPNNWIRGLSYMATHGQKNWPTFISMGLRNELRLPTSGHPGLYPYTWDTWKQWMTAAATAVYNANKDVLIFFSGMDSDFNIEPAVGGSTLLDPTFSFNLASYPWADKFVFELHEYDEGISNVCFIYETILQSFGFNALSSSNNIAPLVISEWGHSEEDSSGAYQSAYSQCLTQYMAEEQIGWMLWVLAGSYYIRSGDQDSDETYGILDHTWDNYRGQASIAAIQQVIQSTYAAFGD